MIKKLVVATCIGSLLAFGLFSCSKAPEEKKQKAEVQKAEVKLGPFNLARHPNSLEGKTVVLRWNGKLNGDKVLTRVAELLNEQIKGVKVVKLWEVDPSTAVSSDSFENSEIIIAKIAERKPDLVIASQAD
jgi:hypothetical protein